MYYLWDGSLLAVHIYRNRGGLEHETNDSDSGPILTIETESR